MNRTSAVLKNILAFFCMFNGLALILSVINLFLIGSLSKLEGVSERIGGILIVLLCLGLAGLLLRTGYRLFKRVKESGALVRKYPLSPGVRKLLGVVYLLIGTMFMIAFLSGIRKAPGAYFTEKSEFGYDRVMGYWVAQALIFSGSALLIRAGYHLLKPVKEKMELLGKEI